MPLRDSTPTGNDVESRQVLLRKKSDAFQGDIVVTTGDILKFALFFAICFLISLLVVGWLLGSFGPA